MSQVKGTIVVPAAIEVPPDQIAAGLAAFSPVAQALYLGRVCRDLDLSAVYRNLSMIAENRDRQFDAQEQGAAQRTLDRLGALPLPKTD